MQNLHHASRAAAALVALAAVPSANANLLVVNPSFESEAPVFVENPKGTPTEFVDGWTVTLFTAGSNVGTYDGGSTVPDGTRAAYLSGSGEFGTTPGDRAAVTASEAYVLTFAAANREGFSEGLFASIEFFDAAGNNLGRGGSGADFLGAGSQPAALGFADGLSVTGVAPDGAVSAGAYVFVDAGGGALFDDFELNAVPEPASAALLGAGLLLLRRRRRTA